MEHLGLARRSLVRTPFEGEPDLLGMNVRGDWIVRQNTPEPDLLRAMEENLREGLGRNVRFVKQTVQRDTIVATGRYEYQRLIDPGKSVKFYADHPEPDAPANGGTGNVPEFLRWVGKRLNHRIVDETETSAAKLQWVNRTRLSPESITGDVVKRQMVLAHFRQFPAKVC